MENARVDCRVENTGAITDRKPSGEILQTVLY